jgi:hypothetical protein
MKKNILFILGLVSLMFAACDPLDDSIKDIKPNPADTKTIALTVTSNYNSVSAANTGIAVTLNKDYAQLPNGTKANVVYNLRPVAVKLADSVFANVQYTVTADDYTNGSAAVGNGTFKTYNSTQVLAFLEWKFPKATTPVNKLVLLTYQFFQSNATPSAGVTVTEAFLLTETGWQKIYYINPAQYAAVGRGINNAFTSADVSTLPTYFNNFLKADPNTPMAKVGDVKYISYKYQQSSSVIHQKVYALIFDGVNWVTNPTPVAPLPFLKKNGTWIPDPTVYYTLVRADYNTIGGSSAGTPEGRSNLAQFGSFDVSGGANNWTEAQIAEGLIVILNAKYASAPVDETVIYNVTYALFRGAGPTGTKQFVKAAEGFKLAPAP